jgi:hypothetical protein
MTTAVEHPLSRALRQAALGQFPDTGDVSFAVSPALSGPCDAVAFFTDHVVVAADVDEDWVRRAYHETADGPPVDVSGRLGTFVAALAQRLGHPPTLASLLAVAPYRPAILPGKIQPGGEVDAQWMAYHSEVRTYQYRSQAVEGTIALGRGPGERWDVQLFIARSEGPRSNGARQLLTAAKTLVPERTHLFGMVPLNHLEVLRRGLHSEFAPVCTEVLFLTRPDRATQVPAELPPEHPSRQGRKESR